MTLMYENVVLSEALSGVFKSLNEWASAVNIDWSERASSLLPVPLPDALQLEDVSKVTPLSFLVDELQLERDVVLYAATVRDIQALSRLVHQAGQNGRTFSALLLLSELVLKSHPRQLEAVKSQLQPSSVLQIARFGHPQLREVAGKLFLRTWGHLCTTEANEVIQFIQLSYSDQLTIEALRAVERGALKDGTRLQNFASATLDFKEQLPEIVQRTFTVFLTTEDTYAKDGAALLLSSHVQRRDCRNYLIASVQMLQSIIEYIVVTKNALVKVALLHAITCLADAEDGRRLVHICGGVQTLEQILRQQEADPDFQTTFHGVTNETIFELLIKYAMRLAALPEAMQDIKETETRALLGRLTNTEFFHRTAPRSQYILQTYIRPLLLTL